MTIVWLPTQRAKSALPGTRPTRSPVTVDPHPVTSPTTSRSINVELNETCVHLELGGLLVPCEVRRQVHEPVDVDRPTRAERLWWKHPRVLAVPHASFGARNGWSAPVVGQAENVLVLGHLGIAPVVRVLGIRFLAHEAKLPPIKNSRGAVVGRVESMSKVKHRGRGTAGT